MPSLLRIVEVVEKLENVIIHGRLTMKIYVSFLRFKVVVRGVPDDPDHTFSSTLPLKEANSLSG